MKVYTPLTKHNCFDIFKNGNYVYVICDYKINLKVLNSKEIICPHKYTRIYIVESDIVNINDDVVIPNEYDIPNSEFSLSTMEKDSSIFLYHWLTYHTKLGVDFFLIYDNNSSDEDFKNILKITENFNGIIFKWNFNYTYGGQPQQAQQNHSIYLAKNKISRIGLTDLDEYIVLYNNFTLRELLKNQIIYLWWLWFGVDNKTSNDPRFYTKCKETHEIGWYHKMIVDPIKIDMVSVHNVLLPEFNYKATYTENALLHHYKGLNQTRRNMNLEDCNTSSNFEIIKLYTDNDRIIPKFLHEIPFYNEYNKILSYQHEIEEQIDAFNVVNPDACVLELGGRYGVVSCVINFKLNNKRNHFVVEPDKTVIDTLNKNRDIHNAEFIIYNGTVSKSPKQFENYGIASRTTSPINDEYNVVQNITVDKIESTFNLNFTCLVADCEGYICQFILDFPELFDKINTILIEEDGKDVCNYEYVSNFFKTKGFYKIKDGFHPVWSKVLSNNLDNSRTTNIKDKNSTKSILRKFIKIL